MRQGRGMVRQMRQQWRAYLCVHMYLCVVAIGVKCGSERDSTITTHSVYLHRLTYTHTHTHIYTQRDIHTYTHTVTTTHSPTYFAPPGVELSTHRREDDRAAVDERPGVCVCIYVRVYECMYVCARVCICVRVYECMYVCARVCMYICMYVCACICVRERARKKVGVIYERKD